MLLSSGNEGTYLEITESPVLVEAVILHDLLAELFELNSILIKHTLGNDQHLGHGNVYTLGRFSEHNVIMACLLAGQPGNNLLWRSRCK